MKIAIISDVHGNLQALRAVLDDARGLGVDTIWSLGDAVSYGPQPKECMDLLHDETSLQIMGNHDAAVADLMSLAYFNENARKALVWTKEVLGDSDIERLTQLPYTTRGDGCLLVHGSPDDPPAWHYISSPAKALGQFRHFTERLCFVGHTHVPFIVREGEDDVPAVRESGRTLLDEGDRYLVNAGSVGQPRDMDPRAAWALFDRDGKSVEIRRVPYDFKRTQALMRERGLPSFLVERLAQGI